MLTESDIRAKSRALIEKTKRLGCDDSGCIQVNSQIDISVGFGGQYQVSLWVTDKSSYDGRWVVINCKDEADTLERAEHLIKGLR